MNRTKISTTLAIFVLTLGFANAAGAASITSADVTPQYTQAGVSTTYTFTVEADGMTDDAAFQDRVVIDLPAELHGFTTSDITVTSPSGTNVAARDRTGDSDNDRILITKTDFASFFTATVELDQTSPGSEGSYTADVTVDDNLGESTTTSQVTTSVDTTAPTSDAVVTSPAASVTSSTSWTVEAQNVDDPTSNGVASGVGTVTLQVVAPGASSWSDIATHDVSNPTFSYAPSSDGLYEFRTVATDSVGNGESVSGVDDARTLDTTAPTVSVTSPASTVYRQSTGSVSVSFDYTEQNPNQATVDVGGNQETINSLSGGSLQAHTHSFSSLPSTEDTYDLTVSITDAVGQTGSDTVTDTVVVDNTDPSAPGSVGHSDSSANSGWDDDTSLDFSWAAATDSLAGIDYYNVYVSTDGGTTFPGTPTATVSSGTSYTASVSDGDAVVLRVEAVDRAGNVGPAVASSTIDVDATAPTVSFDPVGYVNAENESSFTMGGTVTEDNLDTFTIEATDGSSALQNSIGTDGSFTTTFDLSGFAEGSVDITGAAVDLAGTDGSDTVSTVKDTNSPSIDSASASPGLGGPDTGFTISAQVTDDRTGVETVEATVTEPGTSPESVTVSLTHQSGDTYTGTFTPSSALTNVNEGTYTVGIAATDVAGNSQSASNAATFDVDGTDPSISNPALQLQNDANGNTVANPGDTVRVYATATDSVAGVDTVTTDATALEDDTVTLQSEAEAGMNWDGDSSPSESSVYGADMAVSAGSVDDASFTLDVTAVDNVGNSAAETTPSISVDSDVPDAPGSLTATAAAGGQIDLSWNAPADSDLDHYTVYRKTGWNSFSQEAMVSAGTTTYADTNTVDETMYTYKVMAVDDAANEGAASNQDAATADSTAPDITAAETTSTSTIEVTVEDTVTGVDTDSIDAGDFSTANPTVTVNSVQVVQGSDGDQSITVELSTDSFARGATPDVSIGSNSGGISDEAGNSETGETFTGTQDDVAPQDPTGTTATDPINEGNVGSVSVDVTFDNNPEAGTVGVKLSDTDAVTPDVTTSVPADTGSTTTTVSGIDAAALSDGDVTVTARIVDDAGNQNPAGYTAGTTVTKDTVDAAMQSAVTTSPTTIAVTFSEDLHGSTIGASDFSVAGHTVATVTESSPGVVELALSTTMGTGETPQVSIAAGQNVQDLNGNELTAADSGSSVTPADGVAPELTGAETADRDANSHLDAVTLTFSEPVDESTFDPAMVDVASYANEVLVSDGAPTDAAVTVGFDEGSSTDTAATPDVTVQNGAVEDLPGNAVQTVNVTSTDGAGPVLTIAAINSDQSSSSQTAVDLWFTEPVDSAGSATVDGNASRQVAGATTFGNRVTGQYEVHGQAAVLQTGDSPAVTALTGMTDAAGNNAVLMNGNGVTVRTVMRELSAGINLVSFPIADESNPAISSVLSPGTQADVEAIWRYDGSWEVWDPDGVQDFTRFEGGKGYYIVMNDDGALVPNVNNLASIGSGSGSSQIWGLPAEEPLERGWNLIGHFEEFDQPQSGAFSSLISEEHGKVLRKDGNSLVDHTGPLRSGDGYWLFMKRSAPYTLGG